MNSRDAHAALTGRQVKSVAPNSFLTDPPRRPNGGTVYVAPQHTEGTMPVEWFRRAPNGGGTLFIRNGEADDD